LAEKTNPESDGGQEAEGVNRKFRLSSKIVVTIVISVGTMLFTAACSSRGYLKYPPYQTMQSQNQEIFKALGKFGEDGDWLVIRGYKQIDDQVSALTGGVLSHAGILDKDRWLVIESEKEGVHTTPIDLFLDKAHRLILVRPKWAKGKAGWEALLKARSLVGKPYNFSGIFGVKLTDSYYCSELAVEIYRTHFGKKDLIPAVVTPVNLLEWGKILYDSGAREE